MRILTMIHQLAHTNLGRVVFEGPLGGIYYLTESNNRTYIPFPSDDNIECLV